MSHRSGSIVVLAAIALLGCERQREERVEEVRIEPERSGGMEQRAEKQPSPPRPSATQAAGAQPEPDPGEAAPAQLDPRLLDPASLNEQAPPRYTVELVTTEGAIRIDVTRAWAPLGADRFYNLVKAGYFTDVAFFRVIEGFMAQTGLHGNPQVNTAWRGAGRIEDDPVTQSNTRGMVTYATSGPNSRTTQFFINFGDNSNLDGMGFAPFGRVQPASMAIVDRLHAGYGEGAPRGRGPMQALIQSQGNEYLRAQFPELDYIESARIVEE